jgi:nicotinamidase-related amidase
MQSNDAVFTNLNDAGLIDAGRSLLLVIDFQQRLMPAIQGGAEVLRNAVILAQAAKMLAIAALATEQSPRGLGHTAPELAGLYVDCVEKNTFGSCGTPAFGAALARLAPCSAPTLLVCGCEAHVCVLQTALQLQVQGFDVRVVADAVGSRTAQSKEIALRRMAVAGIALVTTEMVLFEWLRDAKHAQFREVLALIK